MIEIRKKFSNKSLDNNSFANICVGKLTNNLGDEIIEESCKEFLETLNIYNNIFSSHKRFSPLKFSSYRKFKYWIIGGSNILGNRKYRPGQLPFGLITTIVYRPQLLMLGCGWIDESERVDLYSRLKIKLLYPKNFPHSVRDSKTKNLLESIGYKNIYNTSCPTIWNLPSNINSLLPSKKSSACVFTLTDYRKDYKRDNELIRIICSNYDEIYFWPQGSLDTQYLSELVAKNNLSNQFKNIRIIPRDLKSFDKLLEEKKIDYIGTRLHGGIRALQNYKRTIIIAIDNRASGIGKDNNLCILDRKKIFSGLETLIYKFENKIQINYQIIDSYKEKLINFIDNMN